MLKTMFGMNVLVSWGVSLGSHPGAQVPSPLIPAITAADQGLSVNNPMPW
ncbi:MAG: hypothetical protein M0020_10000 [Actinomycetota bacterium]|nr:hypothetical protein [Actinomycetota bacterium]